jgi:uncharacterized protein YciI
MKFVNFVKYRDLDKIAGARPAHFAYADQLREQGKLAIGGPLVDDKGLHDRAAHFVPHAEQAVRWLE